MNSLTIPLVSFIPLVSGSLGQLLCLLFQQFIQRLLHASSDQLLKLALGYFLV